MVMWAMSDRAIPRSLRMMEGFGVNTFRLVNAAGETNFVKFHWRPLLGTASVLWDESVKICGADPDFHRRDLFEAIDSGNPAEWELGFQIIDQETADALPFDILDATKLVPEEVVPIEMVGKMVLDRNPDNFFAEAEQVAFCPSHIVPGIDFSEDPLLQWKYCFRISIPSSAVWARRIFTNCLSIARNAPSQICSAMATCKRWFREDARTMSRTRLTSRGPAKLLLVFGRRPFLRKQQRSGCEPSRSGIITPRRDYFIDR